MAETAHSGGERMPDLLARSTWATRSTASEPERPRVSRALDSAARDGVILLSGAPGWGARGCVDRWAAKRLGTVTVLELAPTAELHDLAAALGDPQPDGVIAVIVPPRMLDTLEHQNLPVFGEPIDAAVLAFDSEEVRRALIADGWRAGRRDVDAALTLTDGRASAITILRRGLAALPVWLRSEFLDNSAAEFIGRTELEEVEFALTVDARCVLDIAALGELHPEVVARLTGLSHPRIVAAIAELDRAGLLLRPRRALPIAVTSVAHALTGRLDDLEVRGRRLQLAAALSVLGGTVERTARELVLADDHAAAEALLGAHEGARGLGAGGVVIVGAERIDATSHPWLAAARVDELVADGRLGEARRVSASMPVHAEAARARALVRARLRFADGWRALLIGVSNKGVSTSGVTGGLADALRGLLAQDWRAVADGVRRAERDYRGDEPLGRATRMLRLYLTAGAAAPARDRAADRLGLEAGACRRAGLPWLARLGDGLSEIVRGRAGSAVEDAVTAGDERLALLLRLAALAPALRAGTATADRVASVRAAASAAQARPVLRFLDSLEADPARPVVSAAPAALARIEVSESVDTAEVAVRCFGGFGLTIDGRELPLTSLRPRARMLLRVLALHGGAPVHREILAELLWADRDQRSALHNLHVGLSSVRAAIAEAAPGRVEQVLVRRGEAYALCSSLAPMSDLGRFDAHLRDAEAARHAGDQTATIFLLSSAIALYSGDVLPEDGPAEWVVGARERYRLRAAEAASALARFHLACGDFAAAASSAIRSVDLEPWRDESWRTLMEVHRLSGDGASLERAKQRYRSVVELIGSDG